MAEKAYHVTSSATFHSDSCNKAVIEIKTSSLYRAYKYIGLLYYQGEETKKMERIIDVLS
jgi:hypothetical protein